MPDYTGTGAAAGAGFGPIGAGIGALAGGLFGAIVGGGQKKKARKLLRDNPRPDYEIPQEIAENKNLATQMAATGLPSEQYANAMKNIQRQQMTALRGAQDRRGALAALPGIVQAGADATLNLDSMDAQQKIANQKNLMDVNSQYAGYKDKQWDWNKRSKYTDTYNYAMGLMGSGNQNIANGVDNAASGIGYLASGIFDKRKKGF